jgi:hypothetical protein
MAKITIDNIASGYASTTALNTNFDAIETELNSKVLYRNNPAGEPNSMENDLDMNSNDINNVRNISASGTLTVGGTDYLAQMQDLYDDYLALINRVTISTASPSGGTDGDIWFKVV